MAGCCLHGDELLGVMERVKVSVRDLNTVLGVGEFRERLGTEGSACIVSVYDIFNVKNALVKTVHYITDDK